MEYHPFFLHRFRPPFFIRSCIVVSVVLLFSSKSVVAMPYAGNIPFYSPGRDEAYVQAAADYTFGDPNHSTEGNHLDISENNERVPTRICLQNLGIRARFSSADIVGGEAPVDFQEYDVTASFRLPLAWYSSSGWGVGIRLMASAGVLYGGGDTGLVGSLIPLIALGSQDGRFTLDMGAGGALLSRQRFGTHNFGGSFQFALTVGIGFPLTKRLGIGYRFLHYSDAGIHGSNTTGADFHMLELTYWF